MTVKQRFIDYLNAQVGCIYVWGAQGERDISEEWIRKKETSESNAKRAIALWHKRMGEGREDIGAYDCSGLIMKFLLDEGIFREDLSSRGLFGVCEKLSDASMLQSGDLVFRHNGLRIHHVGVYVGDGTVIESKGRDDGVVRRKLDASGRNYWNRFGRLSQFCAEEKEEKYPDMFYYSGATYVNFRTAPDGEVMGRVCRGENVLVLSDKDGWAEVIKKENGYVRGFCASGRLKKIKTGE